jgi:hypothetical protein
VRKTAEPIGESANALRQPIILIPGVRDPVSAVEQVSAGPGGRQHLNRYSGFIHIPQPLLAHIRQSFRMPQMGRRHFRPPPGGDCARRYPADQIRKGEVLFEGHYSHGS